MKMASSWEQQWKETQDVHQRHNAFISATLSLSADFGLLIVRSAIVLNGGALLALPAYFSAVNGSNNLDSAQLMLAAVFFVAGIILSVLTAYCGYINFQANSFAVACEKEMELIQIESDYDNTHQHRLAKTRKHSTEYWETLGSKSTKLINITLWLAQIFGIAAYVTFIFGCYHGAIAMTSI